MRLIEFTSKGAHLFTENVIPHPNHGKVDVSLGFVDGVQQPCSCIPETETRWGSCTKQDYLFSQVASKIASLDNC